MCIRDRYRLKHEYGASCTYEHVNLHKACWVSCDDKEMMKEFVDKRKRDIAHDKDGNVVFMAESAWTLKMAQDNFPDVKFHFTSEY